MVMNSNTRTRTDGFSLLCSVYSILYCILWLSKNERRCWNFSLLSAFFRSLSLSTHTRAHAHIHTHTHISLSLRPLALDSVETILIVCIKHFYAHNIELTSHPAAISSLFSRFRIIDELSVLGVVMNAWRAFGSVTQGNPRHFVPGSILEFSMFFQFWVGARNGTSICLGYIRVHLIASVSPETILFTVFPPLPFTLNVWFERSLW